MPTFEEIMLGAFPELCAGFRGSPRETCMAFGVECGPGWYPLVWEAMERLEDLRREGHPITLLQIKEKYGALNIYLTGSNEALDVVDRIEERSRHICEECGRPGDIRKGGWIRTACGRCHRARYQSDRAKAWKFGRARGR